jgi:restriction endonuclease Mrr
MGRGDSAVTAHVCQVILDARSTARVILIDGPTLANLLVDHNIGAQDAEKFVLERIDEDFFEEV